MSCKKTEATTGFTQERLTALEAAIAEGVLSVKYSDKEIVYRSMDDMLKARDLIRQNLGLKNNCGEKGMFGGRRIKPKHSKGLDDC